MMVFEHDDGIPHACTLHWTYNLSAGLRQT